MAEAGINPCAPARTGDDLYELSYSSRRNPGVTDDDVRDKIVLPASHFNREHGITGVLWVDPKRFLQVLEGPRVDVEALYQRIRRDTRHTDVRLLWSAPLSSRSFERWGMRAVHEPMEKSIEGIVEENASRDEAMLATTPPTVTVAPRVRHWLREAILGPTLRQ